MNQAADNDLPGMDSITSVGNEKIEFLSKWKRNKQAKNGQSTSHVCVICGKQFARPRSLVLHLRSHNQEKPFSCHLCQKSFCRSDHLKNHVLRHLEKGKHPCNQCDQVFKRADHLRYHEVNEHGSNISLKELRTYSKTSINCQSKNVQCELCGKSFVDSKSLKMHSKIHSEGHKYECKYCGKFFNQRSNLNVHIRKHTGRKPYKCEYCGEHFVTSSKLKTHARKHTGDFPFVCDVCGKRFGESHLLKMHLRIHDNVKSYICTHCGRSFTHSSTLKAHLRIHTGAKPYTCEVCQESFAQISSLIYHKRTHTGEKPFTCDICGNKYTRRTTLNTHRSRHTGDKFYSCTQCDFKCDIANQLRTHVLHHHVATKTPSVSIHHLSENFVMPENSASQNQQENASQVEASVSGELLDHVYKNIPETPCYSRVQPNAIIASDRILQEPSISNSLSSICVASSSDGTACKVPIACLNSDSDNLPNEGNSSLQTLTPAITFQTFQLSVTSSEVSLKDEGATSMDLPSLGTRVMPPELSYNSSQTHMSNVNESTLLTATTRPALSLSITKTKISDADSISSLQTFHPEIISQLYDVKKDSNDGEVPEMMSEPTRFVTRLPYGSLSSQSPRTSNPPQPNSPAMQMLGESLYPLRPIGTSKHCELDNEVIASSTFTCNDDLDMSASIKDRSPIVSLQLEEIKPEVFSLSKAREDSCKKGGKANIKNQMQTLSADSETSICIQRSDDNGEKEISGDVSSKAKLEQSSVDLSQAISTKHPNSMHKQTSKTVKKDLIQAISVFGTDIKLKSCSVRLEPLSMPHASKNIRKTKRMKKSKSVDTSKLASEKVILDNCQICGETFSCKKNFVNHMKMHCGDSLQCSICFREFSRSQHLGNHLLLHSRSRESKCFLCFEEFPDTKLLEGHVDKMHNGLYPFRCNICDFSSLEIMKLKGHVWQMHSDHELSCHVCQFKSKTSKDFKEHMKEHPDEGAFDCTQCGQSFRQHSVLKLHVMRKHAGEKYFACGICSDAFVAAAELQRHLKHHTGDRPFTCEICKKGFIDARQLRMHSKIHTGEKPFKCNECGNQFSHPSTLKSHLRIHTGAKPFKCDICGDAFAQRSSLTGHLQIHNRQKMFTCHLCGKSYTRMATLNMHLHQHTGRTRFSCQECDFKTNKPTALRRHIEKRHRDINIVNAK